MGEVFDPNGDNVTVELDVLGNNFIKVAKYDNSTVALKIDSAAEEGLYKCIVILSDDDETHSY